jgi:acid phosphatase (class A)
MKNTTKLFLLITFLSTSFFSQAEAKPYFTNIITPNLIDQPLTVGSKEWEKEIETIVKLQKNPDQKQIDQALKERSFRPEIILEPVDSKLNRTLYPQLYKLLDNASETTGIACNDIKTYWNIKLPYLEDKNIKTLIPVYDNPSYPSGHASRSYVIASILELLIPEKRKQFQNRVKIITDHQILSGMNYPHDIKGGQQLALLIVSELQKNPEFQKDLRLAKKELEKY